MRRAVYAGSFDPITNGHLWMLETSARLFDEVVLAIGENPDKSYTYSLEDRLALLEEVTDGMPGVRIAYFENQYLVDYAAEVDAGFVIRGIRSPADFEYERVMRHINADMRPEIATVFLMPPREVAEVSSSLVKGLIGPTGWRETVRAFVPECVHQFLLKHAEGNG
jgi:pantetheine-phosphate adenylyltransferase